MKKLLKISNLIIFAAIVASVSTSCGNDSELFEEPVMYQTKAMTRAAMGGEETFEYVMNEGPSQSRWMLKNEGYIEVVFNWSRGLKAGVFFSVTDPTFVDTNDENHVEHNFNDPYIYEYEVNPNNKPRKVQGVPFFHGNYLAVDVVGAMIEYQYDARTHKLVGIDTIDVSDIYVANEPVLIDRM